ncbi:MAG: serine/threonine-protein kinase PknK [Myxococcales bacterium]|nr:serine/threonine-protein kinase PknK [Myxococcales bacterium]
MGRVVRARDLVLDRDVALKLVRPELVGLARVRKMLVAEIRLAAGLSHPHLLPVLDHGELRDGAPFLAMPLADGPITMLEGRPWTELLPRLLEVLDALGALHARGLLHRDLKPENVLLVGGVAMVADLGLAGLVRELGRRARDASGTPEMMSPEQREGRTREFGATLDLFAFGRTLRRVVGDAPVPAGLRDVLEALERTDPYERPSLAADVRRWLTSLGPAARPLDQAWRSEPAATWTDDGGPVVVAAAPSASPEIPRSPRAPSPPHTPPRQVRAQDPRVTPELAVLQELPFVGRETELGWLWEQAAQVASSGRPRLALVHGEPGVGKARLVSEILRRLEEGGHARSVHVPHDGGPAEAARRTMCGWPGEPEHVLRERVERLLPGSVQPRLLDWVLGRVGSDDAGVRWLARWVDARSRRGLVVVWLRRVDVATGTGGLAWAEAMLEDPRTGPVLFVATSAAPDPPGWSSLAGRPEVGALQLGRLDEPQTRALLDAWIRLDPAVGVRIASRCAGNPELLAHLVQGLAAAGELIDEGRLSFTVRPDLELEVPVDARRRLEDRLRRLEAQLGGVSGVVDRLALAGPPTLPDVVVAALADGREHELRGVGLLSREAVGWRFDPLLWEVARDRASPGDAELWNEVAAAWSAVEDPGADLWRAMALVGARRWEEGLRVLPAAVRYTFVRAMPEGLLAAEAWVRCARAVGTPQDVGEALLGEAQAHWTRADIPSAMTAARACLQTGPSGQTAAVAQVLIGEGLLMLGRREEAAEVLASPVVAQLPAGREPWLWNLLGRVAQHRARRDEAIACYERAATLARQLSLPGPESEALCRLIVLGSGSEHVSRARTLVHSSTDPYAEGRIRQALAHDAMRRGDLEEAEAELRTGLANMLSDARSASTRRASSTADTPTRAASVMALVSSASRSQGSSACCAASRQAASASDHCSRRR